jgi:hypothetical protein
MEDALVAAISSTSPSISPLVRQFSGSRLERQLVIRVFDLALEHSGWPILTVAANDCGLNRPGQTSDRCLFENQILEGAA